MLDKERIQRAESSVRQYLEQDLLKKENNPTAIHMYRENSDLSLETAKKTPHIGKQ